MCIGIEMGLGLKRDGTEIIGGLVFYGFRVCVSRCRGREGVLSWRGDGMWLDDGWKKVGRKKEQSVA